MDRKKVRVIVMSISNMEVSSESMKVLFYFKKWTYDLQYQAGFPPGSVKESNLKIKTRRGAQCCI
jgi:hypothetical protein